MGSDRPDSKQDEKPPHRVQVEGFWMDVTPVTNRQFKEFVETTGYVTTAEKAPTLDEIMDSEEHHKRISGKESFPTKAQNHMERWNHSCQTI